VRCGKTSRCASRHGEKGEAPKDRLLVGGHGTLATDKPVRTVGSFWQCATTLWSDIRRVPPCDDPGSLTADKVYTGTAYLLRLNGIIGAQEAIDAKTLSLSRCRTTTASCPPPGPIWGKQRHYQSARPKPWATDDGRCV
jgi:cytochrome c